MAIVTLTEAKAHLRVTHSNDDDLITLYMNAADDRIKNFLNLDSVPNEYAVQAAALLLIGDLYEHRESQSETNLHENKAAYDLLMPYRFNMGI